MSIAKKSLCYLTLFLLSLSMLSAKVDYRVEDQPIALEEAVIVSSEGILKQKENGFVYLDVSNDLINSVVPLLDYPGLLRPRPTASRSMGAHISVFHENEEISPEELGSSFSFFVEEIRSFTLHTRDGLKKLWIIAVNSPELESLREKYDCPPKLKGYDFHITLGKQMPAAPEGWQGIDILSPLNFSDEATIGLSTEGDFVVVEDQEILTTAAKVDAVGQLYLKENGFVYLNVSNDFIDDVSPKLPIQGEFDAVSTKSKKMGAHISVIHEDEMIEREIWELAEAGEWFTFEVKELRYIDIKTAKGPKRLWLLAADSPALERLRISYGLKPKLKRHDFHITLGNEQLDLPIPFDTDDYIDIDEVFEVAPAA
ncbi:MAG: hypothetical protein H7A37_03430 [Chlamydiales bacterium]|nr:hypothetical protein [Chlamydiia bacterium]MCP5507338.1 hypothetical protein [Chlamydiales bacterium]